MKKILAIGGSVIKTAKPELRQVIRNEYVEVLCHNGGSLFHDFQGHALSLDSLLESIDPNRKASYEVWEWLKGSPAPEHSITSLCEKLNIPVLLFTGLACDFWQLFSDDWSLIAKRAYSDFKTLCDRFNKPFHYICMGSAVIHPEVFIKAIAVSKPKKFKADVVDFLDMYRPRTRVARYGNYYQTTHKEFLGSLLK